MSYFTMAGSEFDLPHPTLSRHPPRFYIPDRSEYSPGPATSGFGREPLSMHSRMPSSSTLPYSGYSTPYHPESFYGSGSRSSIAALRHALHSYHRHALGGPLTPQQQISRARQGPAPTATRGGDTSPGEPAELGDPTATLPADLWGRSNEPLEALVDIHRVLYRGGEDPADPSAPAWAEQGREVKRVMEQWFEGDCVYDHPLVRLSSRQSVLTHFALLQLLSTAYLPSFTPSSLLLHARSLTSRVRSALLGPIYLASPSANARDKQSASDPIDEWLASSGQHHGSVMNRSNTDDGWWKLWDVSAECRDIGCMECYEGYHIALIDHVISLTLFPTVIKRPLTNLTPLRSSDSLIHGPPRGFILRLAESVLREFDFLLHWDLPVSTIIEFNEVGKATHVRDVVDVRDVIDTFVPFAKRFSWISRRLTGMFTSAVGSVALTLLPGHQVIFGDPIRVGDAKAMIRELEDDAEGSGHGCGHKHKHHLGSAIGLNSAVKVSDVAFPERTRFGNSLGLQGVNDDGPEMLMSPSMAPDVDGSRSDA
ncbi:hypothetical protein CspHIS471_0207690 [Cutaneotrichosporon sp. HIS471]|nr:hypothetical protein CspHIS471_0207690 [Cutaneotrichosporon sp. HIS471]